MLVLSVHLLKEIKADSQEPLQAREEQLPRPVVVIIWKAVVGPGKRRHSH